ncbi:YiaA/YiaB family inner membrane protein [Thiolinea disciformis]|uniref:YiaA/YiaB family inner membrane protein n=1 Tax=Thiolinea disciformis TaxID=125614 RepID=UPI00036E6EC0|nr:YiaA/YiaB family inner membrane protein [Thiolinea disciformis]
MNENTPALPSSTAWTMFVKITFIVALLAMGAFVFFMKGDLLMKGYLALNSLFLVSSTIMLSKTLRDDHEAQRLLNRIEEAKTHKILKEFGH